MAVALYLKVWAEVSSMPLDAFLPLHFPCLDTPLNVYMHGSITVL